MNPPLVPLSFKDPLSVKIKPMYAAMVLGSSGVVLWKVEKLLNKTVRSESCTPKSELHKLTDNRKSLY